MSLFPFNTGIPASGDNPSVDQPLMLQNNVSTNAILAVDHNTFNVNQGGYHQDIHMVPQMSIPATIAGIGQLFAQTVTIASVSDTQLFFKTGDGILNQLTGSNAAFNGFAYFGNIILQWGVVSGTHGTNNFFSSGDTGTVTFSTANIAFPNNCFIVQTTMGYTNAIIGGVDETGNVAINYSTLSNLSFSWTYPQNSNVYNRFLWFAIGN